MAQSLHKTCLGGEGMAVKAFAGPIRYVSRDPYSGP